MHIPSKCTIAKRITVGKEEDIISRDLLLRSLCDRINIYVKARKGIQGNKHIHIFSEYLKLTGLFANTS